MRLVKLDSSSTTLSGETDKTELTDDTSALILAARVSLDHWLESSFDKKVISAA